MRLSRFIGGGLCLLAAMLWGGQFPVMAGVFYRLDPFTFTSLRYLIAATVLVIILAILEGRRGLSLMDRRIPLAFLVGSIGFSGFNFLIFQGQQMIGSNGALVAAVMVATQPMLGIMVSACTRRCLPGLPQLICILLSFIGVVMVITRGDLSLLTHQSGLAKVAGIMLLGSLCWVLYTQSAVLFPHWSVYRYSALTCLLGLPVMLVINALLIERGNVPVPQFSIIGGLWPQLGYMSLLTGSVAVLCWIASNRSVGSDNGILFMNIVPVTTFVISLLQGIQVVKIQLVGVGCVCVALILNNLYTRRYCLSHDSVDSSTPIMSIKADS